jgi:uncharacterized repeat protein (TIGR03837 family)
MGESGLIGFIGGGLCRLDNLGMPSMSSPPAATGSNPRNPALGWDLFCRVIDNYGDIGVCWRLACHLADLGQRVRLWVDDPTALRWMAPSGTAPVEVHEWTAGLVLPPPADVVVECFGCDPPPAFVATMAAGTRAPVWINLEYLSAEDYVERSHQLRSPQRCAPDVWLDKWFFYPGFTAATGGLLREATLVEQQAQFDPVHWLANHGWKPEPSERVVSLFCYANPQLSALLARLSQAGPCLLLTAPGPATVQIRSLIEQGGLPSGIRHHALPWLSQADYDRLLWACDLNLVRGEDSFVRAQWAGQPFLWQIYPQDDGVHADKLQAFLARHLAQAAGSLHREVVQTMRAWNGLAETFPPLPALPAWRAQTRQWRAELLQQPPLAQQLLDFVLQKR